MLAECTSPWPWNYNCISRYYPHTQVITVSYGFPLKLDINFLSWLLAAGWTQPQHQVSNLQDLLRGSRASSASLPTTICAPSPLTVSFLRASWKGKVPWNPAQAHWLSPAPQNMFHRLRILPPPLAQKWLCIWCFPFLWLTFLPP